MPKCYFADINLTTGTYVLLVEYIADGEFMNPMEQGKELNVEDSKLILDSLATLHVEYWGNAMNDPALSDVSKLSREEFGLFPGSVKEHSAEVMAMQCAKGWKGWTYTLPPYLVENFDEIAKYIYPTMCHFVSPNAVRPFYVSLTHGDPRAENFYFHQQQERRVVGMIDFQLNMVQPVGADISWFCTSSFTVEDCKKNADELVTYYITQLNEKLTAAGKETVGEKEFIESVALAHIFTVLKTFITLGGIDAKEDDDPEKTEHVLAVQNMIMTNGCMLWEHWKCSEAWASFMEDWKNWKPSAAGGGNGTGEGVDVELAKSN